MFTTVPEFVKPKAHDDGSARKKKRLKAKPFFIGGSVFLIVGVAISLVAGHGATRAAAPAQAAAAPVLTVSVAPATTRLVNRMISVNGSVSAWDPVEVSATISGLETKRILVDEGQSVKAGQVLVTLDDSQLSPQLASARAKLRADVANVSKSIQPNRAEDVAGLEAAVAQAKANVQDARAAVDQSRANLDDANQNMTRYHYLASQGAVSAQDYGTRATTARVSQAGLTGSTERLHAAEFALKQAQDRLDMAKAGGRHEDVDIARATADQTRSDIARLEAQLAQTVVRSPVDGIITQRNVHIGDVSVSGKTMFSILRDNRLELRAQVPEADLSSIIPHQSVTITSSLAPPVVGNVREISPLIDSTNRLATVRIDIPSNSGLKAGSYAEGQISGGKHPAICVPAQAVISKDDNSYVFVDENNHAVRKTVSPGTQFDNLVEITSGLKPGDSVIVKGAGFLKDQDLIRVSE